MRTGARAIYLNLEGLIAARERYARIDDGEKALGELFGGRSQLLVDHFMFGPSYQAGCPVNSSMADTVNGRLPHLRARDVSFVFVSQAPPARGRVL